MARNQKKSNSSKSASKKRGSAPSSMLRKNPKCLSIGEYGIDKLNTFADFVCFPGIVLRACGLFTVLGIMIQIRHARNNVPPALVDRLPSFKFYKARYLKSINSRAVVILLAMYPILSYLHSDPETLESTLYSNLDEGVGSNTPYIDKPNPNNYSLFYYGVISRILGLLNSCPATNFSIFNFPNSVKDFKVEDVLKLLPFPEDVMPSADEVKAFLRNEMLLEAENPSFEEEVLPGETGLTALETEIFGDVMSRRMDVSNTLSRGSLLPSNALSYDNIKSVLSRIEFAQYEQSVSNNPVRLKELTALAVERINAKAAAASQQAASVNETDLADRPSEGTEASPSAAILRGAAPSRLGRPKGSKNKPRSTSSSPTSSSPAASRTGSPGADGTNLDPGRQTLVPPLDSNSPSPGELQQKKPDAAALDGVPVSGTESQPGSSTSKASGELGESQTSAQQADGGGE